MDPAAGFVGRRTSLVTVEDRLQTSLFEACCQMDPAAAGSEDFRMSLERRLRMSLLVAAVACCQMDLVAAVDLVDRRQMDSAVVDLVDHHQMDSVVVVVVGLVDRQESLLAVAAVEDLRMCLAAGPVVRLRMSLAAEELVHHCCRCFRMGQRSAVVRRMDSVEASDPVILPMAVQMDSAAAVAVPEGRLKVRRTGFEEASGLVAHLKVLQMDSAADSVAEDSS